MTEIKPGQIYSHYESHSILFNTAMIKKILLKQKWETRRVLKIPKRLEDDYRVDASGIVFGYCPKTGKEELIKCPYGKPGDLLWVRETWRPRHWTRGFKNITIGFKDGDSSSFTTSEAWDVARCTELHAQLEDELENSVLKGVDGEPFKWRPSIFMPKATSRITLKVLSVRAESLQSITDEGCIAEGAVDLSLAASPREQFKDLWDSINAKRGVGWDENPLVRVVGFEDIS